MEVEIVTGASSVLAFKLMRSINDLIAEYHSLMTKHDLWEGHTFEGKLKFYRFDRLVYEGEIKVPLIKIWGILYFVYDNRVWTLTNSSSCTEVSKGVKLSIPFLNDIIDGKLGDARKKLEQKIDWLRFIKDFASYAGDFIRKNSVYTEGFLFDLLLDNGYDK